MKKILTYLLPCFLLTLLLSACSKVNVEESTAPISAAVSAESRCYKSSFAALSVSPGDIPEPILYTGNGFFACCEENSGDSSDPTAYTSILCFVHSDGRMERLPAFRAFLPEELPDSGQSNSSYDTLSCPAVTPSGSFLALVEHYRLWNGNPENGDTSDFSSQYCQYELTYDIVTLNTDGALLSQATVQLEPDDQRLNADHTACDSLGNLLVFRDRLLLAVAADGTVSYRVPCDGSPIRALQLPGGRVAVLSENGGELSLTPLDPSSQSFGKPVHLPKTAQTPVPGNGEYDFFYSDGISLYGGKLSGGGPVRLFRWMDYDICGDDLDSSSLHISDDGTVRGILWEPEADTLTAELFTLTEVPAGSLPAREVLTFAQLQAGDRQFNRRIADYNRSQEIIRIETIDYTVYNSEKDPSAGAAVFLRELLAGGGTDLIPLAALPGRQLAAKGLLENLYPYLDTDSELSRSSILPGVLAALEVNGGLHQAASGFTVQTLLGPAGLVGDTPGWTYADYDMVFGKPPEDGTPSETWATREEVLRALTAVNMDRYLELSTAEYEPDPEAFRQMLDFAGRFPPAAPEIGDPAEASDVASRPEKQTLSAFSFYSMDSFFWDDHSFAGKVSCIGWPVGSGVGSVMLMDDACGISVFCRNKTAAWGFLRGLLTADGQSGVYSLPTNREVFNQRLSALLSVSAKKGSDGEDIVDESGNPVPEVRLEWLDESGTQHAFYAMSQDQAGLLFTVIQSCTRAADQGSPLLTIVPEEAAAYYDGLSSAEEVCSRIRSRASLSARDSS